MKIKKYPLIAYLFCLLAVSVLFTGVTFARYKSANSANLSTSLAAYGCSYTIDDISTTSIPNVSYWLTDSDGTGAASTPRTMRFTLRNYTAGRVSEVDVDGSLRVYMPAEIADKMAFQIAETGADGNIVSYTPEVVLGELIYEDGSYKNYNSESVYTGNFKDYYDSGDGKNGEEENLTVQGTLGGSGERVLKAENSGGSGVVMTVTAQSLVSRYCIGYHRGKSEEDYSAQLFIDLEKEVDYYTIDFALPSMKFTAAEGRQSREYILYMTLTDRIISDEMSASWEQTNDKWITSPPKSQSEAYYYNGAKVLGYHFEQTPQYADGSGTTNVRVTCAYDFSGGFTVSLQHIAPIEEASAASYVHAIIFGGKQYVTYNPSEAEEFSFGAQTGMCDNQNGAREIVISSLYVNPLSRKESDGSVTSFGIYEALAKSYDVRYSALFEQAS